MTGVIFTSLVIALCACVVTVRAQYSSYDSYNDVVLTLLDRMEKMEIQMNEMENRELSLQQEIGILKKGLYRQHKETKRLKVLLNLARSKENNCDDSSIPNQGNGAESDSKAMNNGNQISKPEFHIRHVSNEPVAFSTYVTNYVYHLGINQVIKYDGVLTNEGNAYNHHTGIFTCPQDGLYLISFFVSTIHSSAVWVQLMVDDVNVSDAVAFSVQPTQDDQGGNVAILRLRRGQSVWTSTHFHSDSELATNSEFRHVTFSGVLLDAAETSRKLLYSMKVETKQKHQ